MAAASKQVQSLVNRAALDAQEIKAIAARLTALRTKYQTAAPSVTGTPLQGNIVTLNAWIDSVQSVAAAAVAQVMIDAYVPSHKGEALDG